MLLLPFKLCYCFITQYTSIQNIEECINIKAIISLDFILGCFTKLCRGGLMHRKVTLCKKVTIRQVTSMLTGAQAIVKVKSHQYQWLAGGYDLELEHF